MESQCLYVTIFRWNDVMACLIFQVSDPSTTLLFRATGSTTPAVVTSTENLMGLEFFVFGAKTEIATSTTYGWQAAYSTVTV
jgi:hypothetical protein